ncbi:MAG: DUF2748 domain-containing protein [Rickettsiales bacterium]|nr:MAG: DUF2748 domain-containing protein [Rickettsiales bacterium]
MINSSYIQLMSNIYHILYKLPILEKDEMFIELEELAEMLYNSGKMRIDASDKIDYVRFTIPDRNINVMFSKKELTDRKLLPYTRRHMAFLFKGSISSNILSDRVNQEIDRLNKEINKYQEIDHDLGMKLARIIVQSAHPSVILMLIIEKVEIFISYSHNIGDLLDINSWQHSKNNSGMQSTNGIDVAIFTSSGGDPFLGNEKDQIFGLRIMHNNSCCELFARSRDVQEKWIECLSRFCVLNSYASSFVNIKVIGKGSFARVKL